MKDYSDQEIIYCLKNRQECIVHFLYDKYLPVISRMIYRMGGTREDTKDVFQDALVILIEKVDNDELVLQCQFKSFIYSVCENLWLVMRKKRKIDSKFKEHVIVDNVCSDFTELYDSQLYKHIFDDIFESLDADCKLLLKLTWEKYPEKEIAERLDYTYSSLRNKKCKCIRELHNRLINHPVYKAIKRSEERIQNSVYR